jgi:hypothetical protein
MGKPEERRPFGRLRCRWEYNIKADIKEIQWAVVDCIHLAEDREK